MRRVGRSTGSRRTSAPRARSDPGSLNATRLPLPTSPHTSSMMVDNLKLDVVDPGQVGTGRYDVLAATSSCQKPDIGPKRGTRDCEKCGIPKDAPGISMRTFALSAKKPGRGEPLDRIRDYDRAVRRYDGGTLASRLPVSPSALPARRGRRRRRRSTVCLARAAPPGSGSVCRSA